MSPAISVAALMHDLQRALRRQPASAASIRLERQHFAVLYAFAQPLSP